MMRIVPFVNKIVKQGNSLCVRVPLNVVKELALIEGTEVAIEMSKISHDNNAEMIEGYLEVINKVKDLAKYSPLQKRFFAVLNFKFLEETEWDPVNNKELAKKFWKKGENEFGRKFMADFNQFVNIIRDKVVIEENGTFIVREEYRPERYRGKKRDTGGRLHNGNI